MPTIKNTRSTHNKPFTPFYYIIGWSDLDKWYVGSRTANRARYVAHPDELMTTYFTTSLNYVHPFIEQNGLPDVIWTYPCKTAEEAISNETRIMNEFHNFLSDERWLNKNKAGSIIYDEAIRAKMSEKMRKVRLGRKHTAETKERCRLANLGRKKSPEARANCRFNRLGKKHTEESKEKNRQSRRMRHYWLVIQG